MSEENGDVSDGYGVARLLPMLTAAGIGLVLLVSVVSMFLAIGLLSEVATLEEQGRKTAKATKALQEEVVALRELLKPAKTVVAEAAEAPAATNIDAVDPRNDCVLRAGDKGGIADCIGIDLKDKIK